VRAIEDVDLVAFLAGNDIPLEVCPHSNVCLGICESLETHPFPRLLRKGLTLIVGSDDPTLFNATLTDDLVKLAESYDLDVAAVDDLTLNGVRHSFLPSYRKLALVEEFEREMATLRGVHF